MAADTVPQNDYIIVDVQDNEYFAKGFLLFTPQHVAIMRETENGPIPALVVPLGRVAFAELLEYDTTDEVL